MTEEIKRKRGQRGPGKRPAMAHANLRIPQDVLDFYKTFENYSAKMRDVLAEYAEAHK